MSASSTARNDDSARDPRVDWEALAVAMAVVPGLYSRNKNFALYREPDAKKARARAALLRGIVRHLTGAHGPVTEVRFARSDDRCEIFYAIANVRLERRVRLSSLEAACVAYLAGRANVGGVERMITGENDRARVDAALRRLAIGLKLPGVDPEADDAQTPPESG